MWTSKIKIKINMNTKTIIKYYCIGTTSFYHQYNLQFSILCLSKLLIVFQAYKLFRNRKCIFYMSLVTTFLCIHRFQLFLTQSNWIMNIPIYKSQPYMAAGGLLINYYIYKKACVRIYNNRLLKFIVCMTDKSRAYNNNMDIT